MAYIISISIHTANYLNLSWSTFNAGFSNNFRPTERLSVITVSTHPLFQVSRQTSAAKRNDFELQSACFELMSPNFYQWTQCFLCRAVVGRVGPTQPKHLRKTQLKTSVSSVASPQPQFLKLSQTLKNRQFHTVTLRKSGSTKSTQPQLAHQSLQCYETNISGTQNSDAPSFPAMDNSHIQTASRGISEFSRPSVMVNRLDARKTASNHMQIFQWNKSRRISLASSLSSTPPSPRRQKKRSVCLGKPFSEKGSVVAHLQNIWKTSTWRKDNRKLGTV